MPDPIDPPSLEQRRALGRELDLLLGDQLRRVRQRWFVHGLALVVLLPAAFVLVAFALDHVLRLPTPIRVFHSVVIAGLLGWAAMRWLRYPLSRRFTAVDTALLIERAFPELHQRLVSAIQLKETIDAPDAAALRNQSPELIAQLVAETAAAARALPLDRLFDPTRTTRAWLGAGSVLLLLLGGAALSPATARSFVLRHLGWDVPYPRATELQIELPPAGPELQRTDSDGRSELTIAAGGDLHVSVLARGVVPNEAFLDVEALAPAVPDKANGAGPGDQQRVGDLRSVAMQTRPGGRFRHVFRRLASDFTFRARGGDDDRGDRVVVVHVVHPPQVASIKAELRPPTYTRKPPVVQNGGAIEALVGTDVQVAVTATEPVASANIAFLESGKRLPLEVSTTTDDSGTITAWIGHFVVESADRYQVELAGRNGLKNPAPGTYPVTALQDYAPVGHWLQPDDESNTMLLPDALLCVRGEARDDFGLQTAKLALDAGAGRTKELQLIAAAAPTTANAPAAGEPVTALSFVELIELKQLLTDGRAEGISLQLALGDNREPKANTTELPRRQVQIVDQSQLAAAIGRAFRSLREEAEQTLDLQTDRRQRLQDLQAEAPAPGAKAAQVLTAVEVGQGRVLSVAERLHRGAMRAFDTHLWNHQEPSPVAATTVELYLAWHRAHPEPVAYQPAFYRDLLQRRRQGSLGAMEQSLDPILAMIALCDRLQTDLAPQSVRLLARAQVAKDATELGQVLTESLAVQGKIVATLQELLGKLDEWNDYQDLVQEARALREKQRDVQNRTQDIRGRK